MSTDQDENFSAGAKHFRRAGFVAMRRIFSPAEIENIRRWTDDVQNFPEVAGKYMIYREDSVGGPKRRMLDRIENFIPYHAGFADLLETGKVARIVSALMEEEAVLFKDKINFKLPDGRGFEPHQDMQAGWSEYASFFVTAAIPIDPATEENGCLEIAGGHHRDDLLGALWAPLPGNVVERMRFEACVLMPGDAVFFDSFVPHRSAPNLSPRPRRTLYITYNRRSEGDHRARYYADKRRSFPPDFERKPGVDYSYKV